MLISLATHLLQAIMAGPAAPGTPGDGSSPNHSADFIIGAAALVGGVANMIRPDLAYKLSKWQFRNPEAVAPSDKALLLTRIGGCFAAVVGIVFLVLGFTG
ncbi:DUF6199 family natural product biosynthesis protein [Labedaea rhizosphaerae]|uniref:DUF6199 domain-containing protein n=1 Tax=Labedaea rhizosphaerae TaxID=598644 RepID=A0A4R6SDQ2_LABRH|nr:DUF6199 family natural product biosynthesis protein [Labedaea rhizosphaerae]TDP98090.1 hypothetical protein EV186_1031070 [Labedaea rhizosphaerae]